MAAAMVLAALGAGPFEARAQGSGTHRCAGVDDLLRIMPSQEVHLDVAAYRPGALGERLQRCGTRASDNWFDPAEEPRRQAMGLMFEWAGAFGCALTEYASAPSALGRPLAGPRVPYLREAALLESISGTYEAYADLRAAPPLAHFRATQLLVKIQSRWNRSAEADRRELMALETGGDPLAAVARATLVFVMTPEPPAFDRALESLVRAGLGGTLRAFELGAEYADIAARRTGESGRDQHYRERRRLLLAEASYRGSVAAMSQLIRLLRDGGGDDGGALGFWTTMHDGIARDLEEIRKACR